MHKLLIISLYNKNEYYDKMRDYTNLYINFLKNSTKYRDSFLFIYVAYDPSINNKYIYDESVNTLYIKGNDSMVPGCLDKTIETIKYVNDVLKYNYTFMFRTNVSTVTNIPSLINWLNSNVTEHNCSTEYLCYGGIVTTLQGLDPDAGIIDNTYYKTVYSSGTCILINKNTTDKLVTSEHLLDHNIIDDVIIGHFITRILNSSFRTDLCKFYKQNVTICDTTTLFYRNRSGYNPNRICNDRIYDVERIKHICHFLTTNVVNNTFLSN